MSDKITSAEEMAGVASLKVSEGAGKKELKPLYKLFCWATIFFVLLGTITGGIIVFLGVRLMFSSTAIKVQYVETLDNTVIHVSLVGVILFLIGVWMILGSLLVPVGAKILLDSLQEEDDETKPASNLVQKLARQ